MPIVVGKDAAHTPCARSCSDVSMSKLLNGPYSGARAKMVSGSTLQAGAGMLNSFSRGSFLTTGVEDICTLEPLHGAKECGHAIYTVRACKGIQSSHSHTVRVSKGMQPSNMHRVRARCCACARHHNPFTRGRGNKS